MEFYTRLGLHEAEGCKIHPHVLQYRFQSPIAQIICSAEWQSVVNWSFIHPCQLKLFQRPPQCIAMQHLTQVSVTWRKTWQDSKTEPCTMESLGGNSALTERHRHGTERERLETQFPERLDTLMYIFLGWNISIICITNGATSDIGQYADR